MAIIIQTVPEQSLLRVSGDIHTTLDIPASRPRPDMDGEPGEPYYIGLSDGSLIRAENNDQPAYTVIVEGTGPIEIDRASNAIRVGSRITWVNLASIDNANAVAQKSAHSLPLFRPQRLAALAVA